MIPRIITPPANLKLEGAGRSHAKGTARILNVLYIPFSIGAIGAGIFLLWLPWQKIWENNYMLFLLPQIRPLITNPFFKGAILGLGITDILIGFHQIVHFKETHKRALSRAVGPS